MPTQNERLAALLATMKELRHTIHEMDSNIREIQLNDISHPKAGIFLLKWTFEIDALNDKAKLLHRIFQT